jgi:hypothetical protein
MNGDPALDVVVRDVGLVALMAEVRRQLRAGVHPDAVARWVDAQMALASQRLDAIEASGY